MVADPFVVPVLGPESVQVSVEDDLREAVAEAVAAHWSPVEIRDFVDEALLQSIEEG